MFGEFAGRCDKCRQECSVFRHQCGSICGKWMGKTDLEKNERVSIEVDVSAKVSEYSLIHDEKLPSLEALDGIQTFFGIVERVDSDSMVFLRIYRDLCLMVEFEKVEFEGGDWIQVKVPCDAIALYVA